MATRALQRGMRPSQRESGSGVVEVGPGPVGRSVAAGAVLGEPQSFVGRVRRPVVVGLVAVPTSRAGQAVVVADVALDALQTGMRAGQCEAGGGVVKGGGCPVDRSNAMA